MRGGGGQLWKEELSTSACSTWREVVGRQEGGSNMGWVMVTWTHESDVDFSSSL